MLSVCCVSELASVHRNRDSERVEWLTWSGVISYCSNDWHHTISNFLTLYHNFAVNLNSTFKTVTVSLRYQWKQHRSLMLEWLPVMQWQRRRSKSRQTRIEIGKHENWESILFYLQIWGYSRYSTCQMSPSMNGSGGKHQNQVCDFLNNKIVCDPFV